MTEDRVIRTFQERRQIDLQLQDLAREQDELVREIKARALAERGEAVVPVLLRNLGTTNPLLRGAIGLVAMHLPRPLIAPRLREIAANPQRSDQERLAALMILERYLEEPIEESLYAELRNPRAMLEQSLREVVEHQEAVPDIVSDYVAQLQEEPMEVALTILEITSVFPPEKVLPVLTLLAMDVREEVAELAMYFLGRTRLPRARQVLNALAELLPSPWQDMARRNARKLQMSGVPVEARAPVPWRALVTPPDVLGSQTFWLAREGAKSRVLLGIMANVNLGLQFAFRLKDVPAGFVPTPSSKENPLIIVPPLEDSSEPPYLFLQAPLPHARRWLRTLVHQNYAAEYQLPALLREPLLLFWEETADVQEIPLTPLPEPDTSIYEDPISLFEHPAFNAWYVEIPVTSRQEKRWVRSGLNAETFYRVLDDIDPNTYPPPFWQEVADRLEYMAEWLAVAGDEKMAARALAASHSLRSWPEVYNPFAQLLLGRGLALTFQRLREEKEQWER